MPGWQGVQSVWPAGLAVPAGHGTMPALLQELPAGHCWQIDALDAEKVPDGHKLQLEACVALKVPAVQATGRAAGSEHCEPAGHGMQSVWLDCAA